MFKNRMQAGQLLAQKLVVEVAQKKNHFVVLGIPRGGVVVAKEVAKVLPCLLDVIVVKKISAPHQEELAIGAVGETEGSKYLDERLVQDLRVDEEYLGKEIEEKKKEIRRRESLFRQGKPALDLKDKTVIIVDDGAATGATVIAACREVWNQEAKGVIVALPVIARDTLKKLEKEADKVIFIEAPRMFFAVGQFYQEFSQVEDEEVIQLLASSV
jgi:putative phosphoribosyl transferase